MTDTIDVWEEPYDRCLADYFGHHNLTSDTEPEELLYCSRDLVMGRFKHISSSIAWNEGDVRAYQSQKSLLKELFGDKCLPDKEEQAKPRPHKYSVGQKVINAYCKSEILTISELAGHTNENNPRYKVSKYEYLWNECELEPYTEENKPERMRKNKQDLSRSVNQKTEDMEEKELNLVELLEGHTEELFYSPYFGEVEVNIECDKCFPIVVNGEHLTIDGRLYLNDDCMPSIYPSRALYEKYPLDARAAWAEWAESRKPKRWRAKSSAGIAVSECKSHWEDYTYWYLTDDCIVAQEEEIGCKKDNNRYNLGNYFRTEEEAHQAAEEVRKALLSLQNSKQK